MARHSITVTLQPAYLKYHYIYIPAGDTGFFPPGAPGTRQPVRIETGGVPLAAELQYNSKARV